MSKKIAIRVFCFTAALAVMTFIFIMSAKNATDSSDISKSFTREMLEFILKGFDGLSEQRQEIIISNLQFIIRKSAHAFIYTVLGALFAGGFLTFDYIKKIKSFFVPFACSAIYAASDEIHQLFVQGRSCEFRDMCIDSAGSAIGILIVLLINYIINRKRIK